MKQTPNKAKINEIIIEENQETQQIKNENEIQLRQLDFTTNQSFIITPQKRKHNVCNLIIQSESPLNSPKATKQLNLEENQDKQITNDFLIQKNIQNQLILGDINSFEQFNQIHYNIFQLKTSTLLNLKCQENSPQYFINSSASTTNITPQKDKELEINFDQDNNLYQFKSSQASQTPTKLISLQEQTSSQQISSFTKVHVDTECNCQTTQCIKKYCSCYANNNFCVPSICKCQSCMNTFQQSYNSTSQKKPKLISSQKSLSQENATISCTCQKSFCKKQYCDCYKSGKKCSTLCKCQNCFNQGQKEVVQRLDFNSLPDFD
ncbi:tesmin TSO1-like CXC domain protein (macronuclear) [Tetrahymena thermophila SB210]|uniref:Tesmin TSO1-like CXC domain protein n=1 Tax=Tetrahymena thermophila (strain SB210) TaxID=312017 RepID=Q23WV0_TETTS|nr:tesmin TSO1-like CXC domain protein [Tetrahymena thermophila SB210]EAS00995.2 tesmin TSO1-like CXC domain protein [Tetrahymena thermophila SB210]|eukprot:XP_001021240.2 tesmin TSO1-like CXC domain protein [Tetrahymena thermophila SB210]